jgi:hypothetical protein
MGGVISAFREAKGGAKYEGNGHKHPVVIRPMEAFV